MEFQSVAMSLVKPCDQNNVISDPDAFKPLRKCGINLDPCVRAAFGTLVGRRLAAGQFRPNYPDGVDRILGFNHILLHATADLPSELLYHITFALEPLDNATGADQMPSTDNDEIVAVRVEVSLDS